MTQQLISSVGLRDMANGKGGKFIYFSGVLLAKKIKVL
jgi:hypothetical protein